MCAKKQTKPAPVVTENIVITPDLQKLPEAKALIKKMAELKEKDEIETKLKPIVKLANETFGQEFKSFAAYVKHVEKITGGSQRATRLTDDQKKQIDDLAAKKTPQKDIAKAVDCKPTQVSSYLFSKKQKN